MRFIRLFIVIFTLHLSVCVNICIAENSNYINELRNAISDRDLNKTVHICDSVLNSIKDEINFSPEKLLQHLLLWEIKSSQYTERGIQYLNEYATDLGTLSIRERIQNKTRFVNESIAFFKKKYLEDTKKLLIKTLKEIDLKKQFEINPEEAREIINKITKIFIDDYGMSIPDVYNTILLMYKSDTVDVEIKSETTNGNPYFIADYEANKACSQPLGFESLAHSLNVLAQSQVIYANLYFNMIKLSALPNEIFNIPCNEESNEEYIGQYKIALEQLISVSADSIIWENTPHIDSLLQLCRFNWSNEGINESIDLIEDEIKKLNNCYQEINE